MIIDIDSNVRTLPLRVCLVGIEETEYWNLDDMPEVTHIIGIWLYDLNEQTYCCEMTPSRCLYPIETYALYRDADVINDARHEAIQDTVRDNAYIDGYEVRYVHVRDADAIKMRREMEPETIRFDDVPYEEQLQSWIAHAQSNSFLWGR